MSDQLLLAQSASQIGVLGMAQAIRASKALAAMTDADRAQANGVLDSAASPMERAFLLKEFGAGYSPSTFESESLVFGDGGSFSLDGRISSLGGYSSADGSESEK
jgi:hypothetical protein